MGFLSGLLDPRKHFEDTKRTLGHVAQGDIKGAFQNSFFLNPHGVGGSSSGPKMTPMDTSGGIDPSMFAGDPNDEAFGSFTKPFDVEEFYKYQDPGYAFRLQQGTQAVQNSAAAGSGALSGAALKDLLQYNQDYASSEYSNAFNRYQTQQGNIFGRLFDLARLGQGAASGVGTTGASLAGNAGQFLSNAGGAYGAGYVGAGNALNQGASNYWLMQYMKPQMASAGSPGSV